MTCKDCLGNFLGYCKFNCTRPNKCDNFIDRSEWVHLPCKVGDVLYFVKNNTDACCPVCNKYDGYDNYCHLKNKSYPELSEIPVCNKQFIEIVECAADLMLIVKNIDKFGKTVFLTRKEAEKVLKGKTNERNRQDG